MRNYRYAGVAVLFASMSFGGCALFEQDTGMAAAPAPAPETASRLDVEAALEEARAARALAEQALRAAEAAQATANSATGSANSCQARCEEVETQIERAFQQSQAK